MDMYSLTLLDKPQRHPSIRGKTTKYAVREISPFAPESCLREVRERRYRRLLESCGEKGGWDKMVCQMAELLTAMRNYHLAVAKYPSRWDPDWLLDLAWEAATKELERN